MPTPPLPAEELNRRREAIEAALRDGFAPLGVSAGQGSAVQEAARRLNLHPATLFHTVNRGHIAPDWSLFAAPVAELGVAKASEAELLQGELKVLRKRLRALEDDRLAEEKIRREIFGLASRAPEPPDWLIDFDVVKGSSGVPITVWSDWHWGEKVRLEEMGGLNEFSTDIAKVRVQRLVDRVVNLCFSHMTGTDYPGIVVCLGGDMIGGSIHQELAETNEVGTGPAWLDVLGTLIWALERMADHFGRVFVPCVVGNHGRMTDRPRAKGRVHTSYEWLLYCALERHFSDDPRVRFLVPGEADARFRVFGHRYLLTHGDSLGVRGGDGIIGALGPILRGRVKLHTAEAQVGREFDTLILCHWHDYMALRGVIVNGSLKGFDEYARLMLRARFQPPIQALFFCHPRRGITAHWPIYLEDGVPAEQPTEWVSWAA